MRKLSEASALTMLRRAKANHQSHIKINYEHLAQNCRTCLTPGVCCTDTHFVNVNITRLEAVLIRDTLALTPRLTDEERRAVYTRAREAIMTYKLSASGDSFKRTYSCPLFAPGAGCLVHARAKPAPCVQHACYERWEDMPPISLQWRAENFVEELNRKVYDAAWAWLPVPVWLALVDPYGDGKELEMLASEWSAKRQIANFSNTTRYAGRRSLPVIHRTKN
jgi:hypothetical protein